MILQSLKKFRDEKLKDIPHGFDLEDIRIWIVLSPDGSVKKTIVSDSAKNNSEKRLCPAFISRGVNVLPRCMYDNAQYVLCYSKDLEKKLKEATKKKNRELTEEEKEKVSAKCLQDTETRNKAFISMCEKVADMIPATVEPIYEYVRRFYRNGHFSTLLHSEDFQDAFKIIKDAPGTFISFCRLDTDNNFVYATDPNFLKNIIYNVYDNKKGLCLISGKIAPLTSIMPLISVYGFDQRISLCTFQQDCGFDSYGWNQGENAPISYSYALDIGLAFKALTEFKSPYRYDLVSRMMLFWSSHQTDDLNDMDKLLAIMFSDRESNDQSDDVQTESSMAVGQESKIGDPKNIVNVCNAVLSGMLPTTPDDKFFLLSVSKNDRPAICYWNVISPKSLASSIKSHLTNTELETPKKMQIPRALGLYNIVNALRVNKNNHGTSKKKNPKKNASILEGINKSFIDSLVRSIFLGERYPEHLAPTLCDNIRKNMCSSGRMDYYQAALAKALLIRNYTINNHQTLKPMLDKTNSSVGYLFGRLFAVLEFIQQRIMPNVAKSLSERYYAAASTTPALTFPELISLSIHHQAKLNPGSAVFFDKLIMEIFSLMPTNECPETLDIPAQLQFAIGYYLQKNELFKSNKCLSTDKGEEPTVQTNN